MYLQITTRCNMSCPHCCFNCTKEGEDMSLGTFRKAIGLCRDTESPITLGGGEPTLHRHFERMLLESIAVSTPDAQVFVVTNGSVTTRALMLAELAKKDIIGAQVSQDDYHDPIDYEVVEAFMSLGDMWNGKPMGVRNTTDGLEPQPYGRALELLELDAGDITRDGSDCMCNSFMVKPNGTIVQCGCDDSPIVGNVREGVDIPSECYGECCHSQHYTEVCLDNGCEYLLPC